MTVFARRTSSKAGIGLLAFFLSFCDLRSQSDSTQTTGKEISLPGEILSEYVGKYPIRSDHSIVVTEEDGALFIQGTGAKKIPVFASAKDEFFVKAFPAHITFVRDESGLVNALVLRQNGNEARALKVITDPSAIEKQSRRAHEKYDLHTQNAIEEGGFVLIGGIEQWIQVRGEDRANPVLLFIHGGPGGSALHRGTVWRSWERYFTVVQWDQRGTGRTYHKNGDKEASEMNIDRMTQDGLEVAEYLCAHLKKKKIVLFGGSWGSILSIHMLLRRSDLFAAYVGTGQIIDGQRGEKLRYAHALARAKEARSDVAVAELEKIGEPPYNEPRNYGVLQSWAFRLPAGPGDPVQQGPYELPPGLSLEDLDYVERGMAFSGPLLRGEISQTHLTTLDHDFDLPMFFFVGTADTQAPIELIEEYCQLLHAPKKELVRFEGDHHFVAFNRPEKFLAELLARVRPIAIKAQ